MISKFKIQNSKLGLRPASDLPLEQVVPTGWPALDAILPHGGIPRGRITELQGPMMGGKLTLAQQLIKRILLGGARAAYIDLPGTFFPQHLAADRLLVARPRDWKHALRAADILLASREWDLVAVDLTGHTHEVAPDACARLARSAADSGAVALFLHDHPTRNLGGVVSLRLQVNRKITPGGRSLRIRITKNKLAAPERDVQIPLTTGGTLCAA